MAKANYDHIIPILQAEFRTGAYSLRELAHKHKVSLGFVAKHTSGLEHDAKGAVNAGVIYKQALASDNEHLVNAVNTVVDERTRQLTFFTNSALKNQKLANDKLQRDVSMQELNAHSAITQRNKETVLGKDITTAVQVNNTIANDKMTIDEVERELRLIGIDPKAL